MANRLSTAAILAGGGATRLGGDKAGARLGGRPLIEHVVLAARDAGLEPVVVAKRDTPLPDLGLTVIREPNEPRHPLAGIVASLETCAGGAVVLACDVPLVPAGLIRLLAGLEDELALCATQRGIEPLVGRYPASARDPLLRALKRRAPVREAVIALTPHILGPEELAPFGDPDAILMNVNTPADVERAEALLASSAWVAPE